MAGPTREPTKAYHNPGFLNSKDARALRMLAEYLEPKSRFDHHRVEDTVVFMGSARIKSRAEAEELVRRAEAGGGDLESARMALRMSAYYEAARELAARLTQGAASSYAPAAGPASWKRPTAAPPRPRA